VDILILELISIFQWFNPFFWLLRRVIKENHEYMADRAVLNNGVAVKQYKEILVNQFIGTQFSMANNFNSSLIKSRLKMMTKIKSSNKAKLRYLIGGVMAIALLLVFACEEHNTEIANPETTEKSVSMDDALILVDGEIADKTFMNELDASSIESVDVLKAGNSELIKKYGDAAKKGVIMITLKSGATNAKKNQIGEITAVAYGNAAESDVFFTVDEVPVFPGGEMALRKFLAKTIKYPAIAQNKGIQGKVYVSFVVEKDGSTGRARVVRGVDPSLDTEALRVVNGLPQWTPGKHKGEFVAVSYTVPINFVLQ
jgi:TonB family protein